MNESNIPTNLETISLNEQINYRLNEISKIKVYFECEIKDQELLTKKLSKEKEYTGLISSLFSLISCLSIEIIRKLLYETKKRKKKHNKLLYLCKDKLDCIEMLIGQVITDLKISHEEFKAIMNEKRL